MDEADMDNIDDINELEARLYAQIHHEASDNMGMDTLMDCQVQMQQPQQAVRTVTSTCIVNNRPVDKTPSGRYWSDKNYHRPPNLQFYAQRPSETLSQYVGKQVGVSLVREVVQPAIICNDKVEMGKMPSRPNPSNNGVNPTASGNDPDSVGSNKNSAQNPESVTKISNGNIDKIPEIVEKKKVKNVNKQHEKTTVTGPFVKNFAKMAKLLKYEAKKKRAKEAREKRKKPQIETIVLDSDQEDDDVIEIPVPPPPTLTILDSSDEQEESTPMDSTETGEFAKPQTIDSTNDKRQENSSRCTSPCSVISDDFIGQHDRSRLLNENEIADDEDLICLQETVDNFLRSQERSPTVSADKNDQNTIPIEKSTESYRVTQNDFRATDVYESESDIQESVYSKGTKNSTCPPQQVISDSESDDIQAIEIVQKTKRLRKRRASSNKGSEANNESSESEEESNASAVHAIPVVRGEAYEKCKDGGSKKTSSPTSDNEFINIVNTMAKGTLENDSEESDNADDITARKIAEDVIAKNQKSTEDAVLDQLDDVFNQINHLEDATKSGKESPNPFVEVHSTIPNPLEEEIVDMTLEDESATTLVRVNDKATEIPDHNIHFVPGLKPRLFYDGFYERELQPIGVGWNEEMKRFYTKSWKGESFNVRQIRLALNQNLSWKIHSQDRYPKARQYSNIKCLNCCEFGHHRAKCPRPRKEMICFMCGEKGHREPRCPNTLCMRCGNKTRVFTKSCNACTFQNRLICPICKIRGHSVNNCPDKWRRYHSTITPNTYPVSEVKYNRRRFCCICAESGHIADHCRSALRFLEYPPNVSEVKSHQKSYDDQPMASTANGYHLHYNPVEQVSFQLAENASKQSYYTRCLIAVGMGHLLTRKRCNISENSTNNKTRKLDESLAQKENSEVNRTLDESVEVIEVPNQTPIEIDDGSDEVAPPVLKESEKVLEVDKNCTVIKPKMSESAVSIEMNVVQSQFKIPESTTEAAPTQAEKASSEVSPSKEMLAIDEDSNYSFSEHFTFSGEAPKKTRQLDPLPDFIPLTDINDDEMAMDSEDVGISTKFVEANSEDEEESNQNSSKLPELPCEAKIYLTNFHSKFLLSPDGNKFLVEHSAKNEVKVRLDWTSVGHILVIDGMRTNQDRFHTELLLMFRNLSDQVNRKQLEQSQKVPRKTTVLIRFLRENINQLYNNLGNVNDLHKRLQLCENQHSKSSWKLAEKIRRSLNMIFLGQGMLRKGKEHLYKLLDNLKTLLNDCKDENVPNAMRDEIDEHWKYIFSSYRHENYGELLEIYNDLKNKNELPEINFDPLLLGRQVLDVSLTKDQKDKLEKPPNMKTVKHINEKTPTPVKQGPQTPGKTDKRSNLVINPISAPKPTKQNTDANRKPSPKVQTSNPKLQSSSKLTPSLAKPSTSSCVEKTYVATNASTTKPNRLIQSSEKLTNQCNQLLQELDDRGLTPKNNTSKQGAKEQSIFWSRESIKFIDECLSAAEYGKNSGLVEKLRRVQDKASKGSLSFNDYRAVIQIHNAIVIKH